MASHSFAKSARMNGAPSRLLLTEACVLAPVSVPPAGFSRDKGGRIVSTILLENQANREMQLLFRIPELRKAVNWERAERRGAVLSRGEGIWRCWESKANPSSRAIVTPTYWEFFRENAAIRRFAARVRRLFKRASRDLSDLQNRGNREITGNEFVARSGISG